MTDYVTRMGDCIDQICHDFYGSERGGTVEAVIEANTGLAAYGAKLPAGLVITLPDLPTPADVIEPIQLWD